MKSNHFPTMFATKKDVFEYVVTSYERILGDKMAKCLSVKKPNKVIRSSSYVFLRKYGREIFTVRVSDHTPIGDRVVDFDLLIKPTNLDERKMLSEQIQTLRWAWVDYQNPKILVRLQEKEAKLKDLVTNSKFCIENRYDFEESKERILNVAQKHLKHGNMANEFCRF